MSKKSCFFTTMQYFFTNHSRTSKKVVPKEKKEKKNSSTDKALKMYWRRKLHSRSNKVKTRTNSIPKVIDLTEDEVISPMELKIFDEQNKEIPVFIQVEKDTDLRENVVKDIPSYSISNSINSSELPSTEIFCNEDSFVEQNDLLDKNKAIKEQSVRDIELIDENVTLGFDSDVEIIELEEMPANSGSQLISKLRDVKDNELKDVGSVVLTKMPVLIDREDQEKSSVLPRDLDILDQRESVERKSIINTQKVSKVDRKKRKKVKICRMFTEDEDGMFRCDLCEETFATKKFVQYHLLRHKRPSSSEYKCSICGKWFPWRRVLVHHLKTHLIASNMNNMFGNNNTIVAELKKIEEAELQDIGNFDSKAFDELEKKLESNTNLTSSSLVKLINDTENEIVNLACGYCDQCFRTQAALVDHCRIHMTNLPFMCNICGSLFKQKASLVYHSRIHFRMIRRLKKKSSAPFIRYILRVYSCQDCDRSYVSWTALNQHRIHAHGVSVSNKEGHVKKKDCPKKCADVEHETVQIPQLPEVRNEHPVVDEQTTDVLNVSADTTEIFSCNKCTETFSSKSLLEKHFENKHVVMYKCCHCCRTYRRRRPYEKHMKIHNKSRLLACSFCEKSFAELRSLKEHILSHMQGAFVCKCGRTFMSRTAFLRHRVIHIESEESSCNGCGHLCNSDVDERRHNYGCTKRKAAVSQSTAIPNTRFSCAECGEIFHEEVSLEKHVSMHLHTEEAK